MDAHNSNEFHHRIDLFEPGDKTALVCVDVPEAQRIVVENLTELGYKLHTGLFVEDILLKLQTYQYDLVVVSEHFNNTEAKDDLVTQAILEIPPSQRRKQVVVVLGPGVYTDSDMDAWSHSVDVTVNLADVANIRHVINRAVQRTEAFYKPYITALADAGFI